MNKTNYSYLLLFSLLLLSSCDDEAGLTCNDPTQVVDDCGICRDSTTSDAWNTEMDECGICYGDGTSCDGCKDPEAYTYDENAPRHDCNDCEYVDIIQLHIINDIEGNVIIEGNVNIGGNIISVKSNQMVNFYNELNTFYNK